MQTVDLDMILKANPHIDVQKLQQSSEMSRRIRDLGVRGRGYGLMSPYARRGKRCRTIDRRAVCVKR